MRQKPSRSPCTFTGAAGEPCAIDGPLNIVTCRFRSEEALVGMPSKLRLCAENVRMSFLKAARISQIPPQIAAPVGLGCFSILNELRGENLRLIVRGRHHCESDVEPGRGFQFRVVNRKK